MPRFFYDAPSPKGVSMIAYKSLLLTLAAIFSTHAIAQPLSHAFTYQGQLTRADQSLDSIVDFKFRLYDAQSAGTQIGPEQFVLNHSINAGLFSVLLDFGSTAFSDQQRWLEIDVKALGDIEYTTLSPRQLISVAPVASVSIKPWTITTQGIHYADGQVVIGNTNPQSPLHITNSVLDDDVSVLFNDDVIIEDTDAILTLMSDDSGSAGSGIMFKEIPPSGLLSNQ